MSQPIELISQIPPTAEEQAWIDRDADARRRWAEEVAAGLEDEDDLSLAIRQTGTGQGPFALAEQDASCDVRRRNINLSRAAALAAVRETRGLPVA